MTTENTSIAWLDKRYRQIIEQVKDYAIFTLDNEGRISTWNAGAERILGYTEEEALGQPNSFIFTPEDRKQGVPTQKLEKARTQGRATDNRWHLRRGGERFYASGILTALYDEGEKPSGFAKILRDRTQRYEAQRENERLLEEFKTLNATLEQRVAERTQELEAHNNELEQRQRRFAQAFRAGPIAACLSTLGEERFLEVNDAFTELTGYAPEETVGRSYRDLQLWSSPTDQAKLQALDGDLLRNLEFTLRTKQGGGRTVVLSREIIDLGGERVQLKQFYDITARKEGEQQLMDALQRVMSDTSWFARKVLEELAQVRVGEREPATIVQLTKREQEVLERAARGASNDAIGRELQIATQTVRNYISTIYDKLGVHSRAEAVVWARERGIV